MGKKTSVKVNFLYQAFYEILVIVTPLIVSPYVSRVLGATNIGIYSYTQTIANYFVLFAALGIKNYGNREIAKARDNKDELSKTFSEILFLHFFVAGLAVIVYYIYSIFIQKGQMQVYTMIMGIYVIGAFFDISWFFFGLEQFKITVTRNSIIKIGSIVFTYVFVRDRGDLWKYIALIVVTNFVSQLYLWLYVKKNTKICRVGIKGITRHLPQMLILFIPTIAISLYNYMDKIMVGLISSEDQLGLYDNAEKIIFTASQLIGAVGVVMLPKMSNVVEKHDMVATEKYINTSMQLVMCMSFALTGGIIGVSRVFAPVFWGKEFIGCATLLLFLAIALPFKGYANVLRTQYLIPRRFDKAYTISVCLGALVNLITNYLLIPSIHALGAVVGTIIAEMTVCIFQAIYCKRELPIFKYVIYSVPYLFIGAFMAAVVYGVGFALGSSVTTLVMQIIVGVIVYSIVCYLYFRVTNNTVLLKIVNSILSKVPLLKKII